MSDQAQGLRTLADQARRDQSDFVPGTASVLADTLRSSGEKAKERTPALPELAAVADGYAVAGTGFAPTVAPPKKTARVIAVTSGKGGVGKTNFSTSLALVAARNGQRVIVLDADLGLANLHVVLGITPHYSMEHVLRGERTLRETLYPGPGGIHIIGGASGLSELANLEAAQREDFIFSLQELDTLADLIIIDTGAGLSRNVLAFLHAAEEILVVTTPEPTAITDAYATIKVVSRENPASRMRLVVNMAQNEKEAVAAANRIDTIARQFLRVEVEFLGWLPLDPAVQEAVRAQKPFVLLSPHSAAAQSVARIATRLGLCETVPQPSAGITGFLSRMTKFFGNSRK